MMKEMVSIQEIEYTKLFNPTLFRQVHAPMNVLVSTVVSEYGASSRDDYQPWIDPQPEKHAQDHKWYCADHCEQWTVPPSHRNCFLINIMVYSQVVRTISLEDAVVNNCVCLEWILECISFPK